MKPIDNRELVRMLRRRKQYDEWRQFWIAMGFFAVVIVALIVIAWW